MPSLGEQLRAQRERKGITLEQAAADTRIREKFLTALEGGDYPALPGAVYTRGFLRNYAEYLDLETGELVALFQQERERKAFNGEFQFKPADRFELNLNGFYSRFGANNINQNYLAWGSNALGGGGTLTNGTVQGDTVVAGTIASTAAGTKLAATIRRWSRHRLPSDVSRPRPITGASRVLVRAGFS